jgi:predicted PurR-regulated permease PerM
MDKAALLIIDVQQEYFAPFIMALVSTFMATPLIRWLMKEERSLAPPLG